MALNTKTFDQLVSSITSSIQSSCSTLLNFTIGSILRAISEANAAVVLWLQGLLLQLLAICRAATSTASDLDSWMNDYGLTRLPAVAASGQVAFSRFTATNSAFVPVGALVVSSDGTQTFAVTADPSNADYSSANNGFTIPAGTTSLNILVTAQTAGSGGNVAAGAINTLSTPIAGVDTVSNGNAFSNGVDAETDSAFRTRFQNYIAGLSKATKLAVGYAVESVQAGVVYNIVENQDYNGTTDDGYFYVVADDGSGAPPQSFLTNVANAVDAVRPIGSRFGVFGPSKITANVAMTLTTAAGYTHSTLVSGVQTALQNYINALPLGTSLSYSRLLQVAYDSSAGITNITGYTLNNGTADLAATAQQVIRAGTMTIS